MISLIVDIYKANGTSVTLEVCPVGDHHEQGRVEREIHQIKETIERTVEGESLTALGSWDGKLSFFSFLIPQTISVLLETLVYALALVRI